MFLSHLPEKNARRFPLLDKMGTGAQRARTPQQSRRINVRGFSTLSRLQFAPLSTIERLTLGRKSLISQ